MALYTIFDTYEAHLCRSVRKKERHNRYCIVRPPLEYQRPPHQAYPLESPCYIRGKKFYCIPLYPYSSVHRKTEKIW